ncbi:MAG: lipoprotein NlpD [Gammaproteobacteria bacterium]|jgi:lipoprotein NlpD
MVCRTEQPGFDRFGNFCRSLLILMMLLLPACMPLFEPGLNPEKPVVNQYRVRLTDTLYSIAWRYGLDHNILAKWNGISESSTIYPGQKLFLSDPGDRRVGVTKPAKKVVVTESVSKPVMVKPLEEADVQSPLLKGRWLWPTSGKVLNTFSAKHLSRRGIDISGEEGQDIVAVSPGKVVYSGDGLAGYGNLIIIKHSNTYLSAYAYCRERLVEEGEFVKRGMKIASMGIYKDGQARLHFEVRKNGKPVDPLGFLVKQ